MRDFNKVHETILISKEELDADSKPLHQLIVDDKGGFTVTNCDQCSYCCHSERGNYARVEIALTESETKVRMKGKQGKFLVWGDLVESVNGTCNCPNFTGTGCAIFDKRPYLCRSWPFMLYGNEIVVDRHCPAIKNATLHELGLAAKKVANDIKSQGDDGYNYRMHLSSGTDTSFLIHTGIYLEE